MEGRLLLLKCVVPKANAEIIGGVTVMSRAIAGEGRHMCHLRNTILGLFGSSGFLHTYLCRIKFIYEKYCSLRFSVANRSQGMASVHTYKYFAV